MPRSGFVGSSGVPRILTGADGRFVFRDLPMGSFTITATKGGYAEGASGRRRLGGAAQPVVLTAAEKSTDLVVRVWKNAVITGTVTDEAGEPVVGLQVRALARTASLGSQSDPAGFVRVGVRPFTPIATPRRDRRPRCVSLRQSHAGRLPRRRRASARVREAGNLQRGGADRTQHRRAPGVDRGSRPERSWRTAADARRARVGRAAALRSRRRRKAAGLRSIRRPSIRRPRPRARHRRSRWPQGKSARGSTSISCRRRRRACRARCCRRPDRCR